MNDRPNKFDFITHALQERQTEQRLRQLRTLEPLPNGQVCSQGKVLINFSSNDYLGLSQHPAVLAQAQDYLQRYGAGAGASRLVTGNFAIHEKLEAEFATFLGREAALLFGTGFQANSTLLPTLFNRSSLILCDRFVHNSLLQGIRASQAKFIRYRHNDLDHLKHCLKQAGSHYNRLGIVTETVFSMDGDRADLEALVELAKEYQAWLYVDDAHGVGVLGEQGRGLAAAHPEVDIIIATLGKAFGSFGAIVGCSQQLKTYWANTCPGVIYTTALPPATIGAIQAALELMPSLDPERTYLEQQSQHLHQVLQELGYATSAEPSHILPILLQSPDQALALAQTLEERGILATAIRSPTVPPGSDRVRLTLSSVHPPKHYQALIQALRDPGAFPR
ncbi:MAG: aminotransferase class I/II-fold pyridoxal phosphate-dependent enzyme [Prochlorotrichaceae cyanobacterium]